MDAGWFMQEVHQRTRHCDFPPLVVTATDGDNGGWFRNVNETSNFWYVCYRQLLDWVARGDTEIEPIFIHDYLDRFGAHGEVRVRTGAWNTGGLNSTVCTTGELGGDGTCIFLFPGLKKKSVSFTVTSVVLPGQTYAAASNHDPDGDSNGTTITVIKP